MEIPVNSVTVLLKNGFDRDDIAAFAKRKRLNIPPSNVLSERIVKLKRLLGSSPHSVCGIIRMWPEILQYRSERIEKRIGELSRRADMSTGAAVRALNKHPTIIGIHEDRIREIAEIIRHLKRDPADYPQAFIIDPAVVRGRCVLLKSREGYCRDSFNAVIQPGHAAFKARTGHDSKSVLRADPGHGTFIATFVA